MSDILQRFTEVAESIFPKGILLLNKATGHINTWSEIYPEIIEDIRKFSSTCSEHKEIMVQMLETFECDIRDDFKVVAA